MREARWWQGVNPQGLRRSLARVGTGILDAIFPMRCVGCGEFLPSAHAADLCTRCRARIRLVRAPLCPLCGLPYQHEWPGNHLCRDCLLRPPPFLRARSWACYQRHPAQLDPLRRAVHQFKYGRQPSHGKVLGHLMATAWRPRFGKPDLIIPVPLHTARLRWRGFNQAALLGRAVSRSWVVPLDPFVLRRSRPTRPQTELPHKERQSNVRGAFSTNPRRSIKGRHLLLVDDIYTSGATVKECTRVLRRGGARTVQVLTLARTV